MKNKEISKQIKKAFKESKKTKYEIANGIECKYDTINSLLEGRGNISSYISFLDFIGYEIIFKKMKNEK